MDVSTCHFLVDLDSPPDGATDLEPRFSAAKDVWKSVYSEPFLDAAHSHPLLRAFFIPFVSAAKNSYLDYHLLKRVSLDDKTKK